MACRELASKVKGIGEQGKVSGSGLWFEHGRLLSIHARLSAWFQRRRCLPDGEDCSGRTVKQTCAAGRHGYFSWGSRGVLGG